jgi:hypothetical protein
MQPEAIRCNQRQSEAIRGNQRQSEAIKGTPRHSGTRRQTLRQTQRHSAHSGPGAARVHLLQRQSTGNQQAINRQSTGNQQAINRQSTGNQKAINDTHLHRRQSTGNQQAIKRQSTTLTSIEGSEAVHAAIASSTSAWWVTRPGFVKSRGSFARSTRFAVTIRRL